MPQCLLVCRQTWSWWSPYCGVRRYHAMWNENLIDRLSATWRTKLRAKWRTTAMLLAQRHENRSRLRHLAKIVSGGGRELAGVGVDTVGHITRKLAKQRFVERQTASSA